jgi:predicted pyridoxine 5'-phosphate oxidase superfamily flavin-nucleotide-binding protein
MESIYHAGEIRVQQEAGAVEAAKAMERQVLPVIAYRYVDFIQGQPLVFLGSADGNGMVWSSILCGEPGFMHVTDERTLRIDALPDDRDPLAGGFCTGAEVGLLLLDFATRRRLRLNGAVEIAKGGFSVRVRQAYANCPRYIQARTCEAIGPAPVPAGPVREASSLNRELRDRINRADTFFIASRHPSGGADVSHRGGYPGFVQATDGETLVWPDYNGNAMFNTLGNIVEDPRCGLLFPDFETGGTLRLSGEAAIVWDLERAAHYPGAERLIEFRVGRVVEIDNEVELRCRLEEYSPDNPWFC